MDYGPETTQFEELLRKRGVSSAGNAVVEREILQRYQDDCAVLVLDSSGFTRLTQEHGIIHFLSLVVALHDMLKPVTKRNEAISCWGLSDNLIAVFPTAHMALRCAVEMQQTVAQHNLLRNPAERLKVSIGVGCGKMLRVGCENVFGDPMNQACKLGEDIARADEILITEAVYKEAHPKMSGLAYEPRQTNASGVELRYYSVSAAGV